MATADFFAGGNHSFARTASLVLVILTCSVFTSVRFFCKARHASTFHDEHPRADQEAVAIGTEGAHQPAFSVHLNMQAVYVPVCQGYNFQTFKSRSKCKQSSKASNDCLRARVLAAAFQRHGLMGRQKAWPRAMCGQHDMSLQL